MIAIHIATCVWIIIPKLLENSYGNIDFKGTWAEGLGKTSHAELYIISLYWCFTTITTVGYGDILPATIIEKIFTSIVMLFGVTCFAYITSAFTTILSQMDMDNSKSKQNLEILNQMYKKYHLPIDLYATLRRNIELKTQMS